MVKSSFKIIFVCVVVAAGIFLLSDKSYSQIPIPKVTLGVERAEKPEDVAMSIQLLFLMTVLSLAPAILILMTSFTRIIIIFHFVRQALGTQQMPTNQILIGLALFLTLFIMSPVWNNVNENAIQPYLNEQITSKEALKVAEQPVRKFMLNLVREKDLSLFVKFADMEKPDTQLDIPMRVLVPAFVVSELRIAFQIGFILYIPFLMIDMIVASILMSMGMLMLPPIMISLPFKILLFVLVDGWYLIVDSVVKSFG